jgi:hypothetical protein
VGAVRKRDAAVAAPKLQELVLHIAKETKDDPNFGRTKLAKVLFYSDFAAYADSGESISGATYVRQPNGPFPRELPDAEKSLLRSHPPRARVERWQRGRERDEYEENRILPLDEPNTRLFEPWQLLVVGDWIRDISRASAKRISDLSHRHPGWVLARETGVDIPYETAALPQERPTGQEAERAKQVARDRGWLSNGEWVWERNSA